MPKDRQILTYIDLFAGCGGLSLGLHNSSAWQGIFAIERSPDAFKTLSFNLIENSDHFAWPDWLPVENHDIRTVLQKYRRNLISLKGHIDLIVGGPPCQGFSFAGRRQEEDERNTMVHPYLDFIKLVRPRTILFENVKGFKLGFRNSDCQRGIPYSEIVVAKLRKLGYKDAQAQIINFSNFGIPQERQRCIIYGTIDGTSDLFFDALYKKAQSFLRTKGLHSTQILKSAISDLKASNGSVASPDSKGFKAGVYASSPESAYQKLMRKKSCQVPDSHRFANHTWAVREKFKQVIKLKLTSQDVREIFGTKKASTKLLYPDLPTPTLTTLPDDYVHYSEPRILTVREYARIQSFPDWYEFKGKYTTGGDRRKFEVPRYSQIGNAIPPLFGELAGLTMSETVQGVSRGTDIAI